MQLSHKICKKWGLSSRFLKNREYGCIHRAAIERSEALPITGWTADGTQLQWKIRPCIPTRHHPYTGNPYSAYVTGDAREKRLGNSIPSRRVSAFPRMTLSELPDIHIRSAKAPVPCGPLATTYDVVNMRFKPC